LLPALYRLDVDNRLPEGTATLAIGPGDFGPTIAALGEVQLLREDFGWRRAIVEKPFGYDLDRSVRFPKPRYTPMPSARNTLKRR
jgi:glucose-6-phosphate 1-dehydrogenase